MAQVCVGDIEGALEIFARAGRVDGQPRRCQELGTLLLYTPKKR